MLGCLSPQHACHMASPVKPWMIDGSAPRTWNVSAGSCAFHGTAAKNAASVRSCLRCASVGVPNSVGSESLFVRSLGGGRSAGRCSCRAPSPMWTCWPLVAPASRFVPAASAWTWQRSRLGAGLLPAVFPFRCFFGVFEFHFFVLRATVQFLRFVDLFLQEYCYLAV